jgi:hypothetical protein
MSIYFFSGIKICLFLVITQLNQDSQEKVHYNRNKNENKAIGFSRSSK